MYLLTNNISKKIKFTFSQSTNQIPSQTISNTQSITKTKLHINITKSYPVSFSSTKLKHTLLMKPILPNPFV